MLTTFSTNVGIGVWISICTRWLVNVQNMALAFASLPASTTVPFLINALLVCVILGPFPTFFCDLKPLLTTVEVRILDLDRGTRAGYWLHQLCWHCWIDGTNAGTSISTCMDVLLSGDTFLSPTRRNYRNQKPWKVRCTLAFFNWMKKVCSLIL